MIKVEFNGLRTDIHLKNVIYENNSKAQVTFRLLMINLFALNLTKYHARCGTLLRIFLGDIIHSLVLLCLISLLTKNRVLYFEKGFQEKF